MLRIKSGHSVRYYTDATSEAKENYYTGAVSEGEPPGRWYGGGAEQLGLSGLVKTQDMIGVYERFLDPRDAGFADPSQWDEVSTLGHTGRNYLSEDQIYAAALDAEPDADAARRDELRVEAGQRARHNVSYHDATFSVPKSVTVAHAAFEAQEIAARRRGDVDSAAAWGVLRKAVEDAIWAGNNAALDYLSMHAGFSRIGHHGGAGGRWIDAHGFTVASFFQHDSRDHDPHLHIHNTILNRVLCADGVWRTVDGRALRAFRGAAASVGERVTEARLAESLGVLSATRPDGKSRELVGVDQVLCGLLSSRNRAIGPKAAELIAAFEARHGWAPTALVRDRLSHQAQLLTRRSKTGAETIEARLDRVEAQLADELGTGFAQVAHDVLAMAQGERAAAAVWSAREVLETALAAVQEKQSAWSAPDLTREISNALPDNLGITDGTEMGWLLDELTDQGLALAIALDVAKPGDLVSAPQFRLANGRSAFVAPGRARYATPEQLHTERLLVAASSSRDAAATSTAAARAFVEGLAESGIELGADQAAVITGVLTCGARVESLVGPAGAGKSFVLGVLAQAWSQPRTWAQPGVPVPAVVGRVFGLAASQRATSVLAAEGITAANTAAWLAAQVRLGENRGKEGDQAWALRAGDLVVIDESSMADTPAIAAVHARVAAAGAKLLLVGDHKQLGAVGAGGLGELLAERGRCYELTEVRRFHAPWERGASLRLRAGEVAALEDYHREGRILDGGTLEAAETRAAVGWLADTLAGKHSILVVDSNEQAARINSALRARLVELGRVCEEGLLLGRDGTIAGVGDMVQARRLAWDLAGFQGNRRGPITREQYRVLETRDDGSMVVAPIVTVSGPDGVEVLGERMTLPASYVDADLTLGYAATVHTAEGLTVDTGHTVATPRTSANALYPATTRGRESNHLYVVTRSADQDASTGEVAQALTRNPRAVLATILEAGESERSATAWATDSAAEAVSVRTAAERLAAVAEVTLAERTSAWLDELTHSGELTIVQRRRLAAEDGGAKLGPILR
ncbi:MAG: relaxase domain-containing protein, partial [Actinomycetota bacterium]|nr:relaxase domain-containing protein [Actinomycetota bacterium]